jgi:hypothetical protein
MNSNSIFYIGKDHDVCEDYALASSSAGLTYAIVCDGCSASPDVDFGARALAMSAKRTLLLGSDYSAEKFGEITIQNAQRVFDVFPYLHPQALDATLLVAWVKDKQLTAYMYGDGVLIHKYEDKMDFVHVSLSSGAPDYLSYSLNSARRNEYDKLANNDKVIHSSLTSSIVKPFRPVEIQMGLREGDVVSIISDGINSFKKADGTTIPWQDLIEEFTGYKTFEGEFVLRRLAAFKRKCLKDGITHYDDISIASIVV